MQLLCNVVVFNRFPRPHHHVLITVNTVWGLTPKPLNSMYSPSGNNSSRGIIWHYCIDTPQWILSLLYVSTLSFSPHALCEFFLTIVTYYITNNYITSTGSLSGGQLYGPNDIVIDAGCNFMYINASYEQRQEARYLGAKWDKAKKLWFVVYKTSTDAIVTRGIVHYILLPFQCTTNRIQSYILRYFMYAYRR